MRYSRFTLTGLTATALLLGCGESTTPVQTSGPAVAGPRSTVGVGFTATSIARGNVGVVDVISQVNGYDVQIKTTSSTDVAVSTLVAVPGGTSGWHSHLGPVIVVVKTGELTLYRAGHHGICSRTVYPAGSGFVETGGEVVLAANEGSIDAVSAATSLVPAGGSGRIDQHAPGGHCPP